MASTGGRGQVDGARWTAETEVLFIDLVYEEVLRGNYLGTTFTTTVWKEVNNTLNNLTSMCYSVRQCREKLTRIKLHWGKFRNIMLSDTGLGWDSERELPTASDQWWSLWEEAHPKDIGLRRRPCRRYMKLCSIFARNTATGNRARSSAQLPPGTENETFDLDEDDEGFESPTPSHGVATGSHAVSSKRRKQNKHVLERLVTSLERSSNSITSRLDEAAKEKEVKKSTIKTCIEVVHALPGVTVDMVVAAIQFFTIPDNRAMFLELTQIEQIALLQRLAR